jgi:hypothetical protein
MERLDFILEDDVSALGWEFFDSSFLLLTEELYQ